MTYINHCFLTFIILISFGSAQEIDVSPASLNSTLYFDESETQTLSIKNSGTSDLTFSISIDSGGSELTMELLGQLDYTATVNDVWGYTAPDGTELAIVGTKDGTSFVNVTSPENPNEVAFVSGPSSIWRDIKTYGSYAYIVTEGGGGLQIVDLSDPLNPAYHSNHTSFTNAHNIFIDEFGFAYVVGSDQANGGLHILDLSNPTNPQVAGSWSTKYVHDVFVRDNNAYAACIYDGTVTIIDVTDKSNIVYLEETATPANFTHNTWLTDDSNYLLTTDETTGGLVTFYTIHDLNNINQVATYQSGSNQIPHNVFVEGNYAFLSAYANGLIVLDITNPMDPKVAAQYDTYPGGSGFDGAWGTYPYAANDLVFISDQSTGLYVLQSISNDWLSASPAVGTVIPGDSATVDISIDATTLDVGSYNADIIITSNDDDESTITVPVSLTVNGATNIVVVDTLNMGQSFVGYSTTASLEISNNGTDALFISSITPDTTLFTVSPTSLFVASGATETVTVEFSPTTAGDVFGNLTIISNDPNEGTAIVTLMGSGTMGIPAVLVSPGSMTSVIEAGDSTSQTLTISNTGTGALDFSITMESTTNSRIIAPLRKIRKSLYSSDGYETANIEPNITYQDHNGKLVDGIRCATPSPTEEQQTEVRQTMEAFVASGRYEKREDIVLIPVAMHIVRGNNGEWDVPDEAITAQIDSLNRGFANMGYQFMLFSTDRTNNTYWSNGNDEAGMKEALAIDPATTLNFYLCNLGGGLLGYATFPDMYPEDSYMHGVVCLYSSVPGGSAAPFDEGDTGTHEVGHYVGLYHTFQGGCTPPGDEVDDTPFEGGPHWGCSEGTDTCPNEPGDDPIHNFMDYSDDICLTEFTPGQGDRSATLMAMYKPTMYSNVLNNWLTFDPLTGSLNAGESIDVTTKIHAGNLYAGDYSVNAIISTNDPVTPTVSLPVSITVTGEPEIVISVESLDFGLLYSGADSSMQFEITNEGTDVLNVSALTFIGDAFSSDITGSFEIAPGTSRTITVTFAPGSVGNFEGSVQIENDDADESTATVSLLGSSVAAPAMALSVSEMSDALAQGETAEHHVTITNTGGVDYEFTIEISGLHDLEHHKFEDGFGPYSDESPQGNGGPWQIGNNVEASSDFYVIPEHTTFAYINDDATGANTPPVDAYLASQDIPVNGENITLNFEAYFPEDGGACGTSDFADDADVFISVDGGSYQSMGFQQTNESAWENITIDLTPYSAGASKIKIAFHYNDCGGNWAYGFAIDDVRIEGLPTTEWLLLSPMEGFLATGESQEITATLSAEGVQETENTVSVHFRAMDYVDEVMKVNLTITEMEITEGMGVPDEFALNQNYPNPFNPVTVIRYDLPQQANVSITIYNLKGRKVRTLVNDVQDAGFKMVQWNGRNDFGRSLGTGIYIYRIIANDFIQTKKMVLMK